MSHFLPVFLSFRRFAIEISSMSSLEAKRVWRHYNTLKNCAQDINRNAKILEIEEPTYQDADEAPPSASASAHLPSGYLSIPMVVYPSSAPFIGRGLPLELQVPYAFPHEAPRAFIRAPIRHPNVDKSGRICSAKLDNTKAWEPTELNIIITELIQLIDEPNLKYVLDAETVSLYESDRSAYNDYVKKCMEKYGKPQS